MKTNDQEAIEATIKEYSLRYSIPEDSLRRMLLEAQIAALETLNDNRIGQCIGGVLREVIFSSEAEEFILDLKNKLRDN